MSQLKVNSIIPVSGVPTGGGGGIVQIKQSFKNDSASTNSGTYSNVSSDLNVTITPTSSSSKILFTGYLYIAGSGAETTFRLKRGNTDIGVSSTLDDDADGSFCIGGSSLYRMANFAFLDSPSTTSATTYSIEWRNHAGTMYLNRTWDSGWFHGASATTCYEVSA